MARGVSSQPRSQKVRSSISAVCSRVIIGVLKQDDVLPSHDELYLSALVTSHFGSSIKRPSIRPLFTTLTDYLSPNQTAVNVDTWHFKAGRRRGLGLHLECEPRESNPGNPELPWAWSPTPRERRDHPSSALLKRRKRWALGQSEFTQLDKEHINKRAAGGWGCDSRSRRGDDTTC